jgi:hypothetical protein
VRNEHPGDHVGVLADPYRGESKGYRAQNQRVEGEERPIEQPPWGTAARGRIPVRGNGEVPGAIEVGKEAVPHIQTGSLRGLKGEAALRREVGEHGGGKETEEHEEGTGEPVDGEQEHPVATPNSVRGEARCAQEGRQDGENEAHVQSASLFRCHRLFIGHHDGAG